MEMAYGPYKGHQIKSLPTRVLKGLQTRCEEILSKLRDESRCQETLGFGKYAEVPIGEIDDEQYCTWLEDTNESTLIEVREALGRRGMEQTPQDIATIQDELKARIRELDQARQRALQEEIRANAAEDLLQVARGKRQKAERERDDAKARVVELLDALDQAKERADQAEAKVSGAAAGGNQDDMLEIIQAGFRALAHKHHPDKGGKPELM